LKHVRQLTEYIAGMDARIGFSNEHIVGELAGELSGPEYATSVGLLMKGLEKLEENRTEVYDEEVMNTMNEDEKQQANEVVGQVVSGVESSQKESTKPRKPKVPKEPK